MGERITPLNNRQFTTGKGDWVGDLVWHPEVISLHQGFIAVTVPSGGEIKIISLSYPHVKPVTNKYNDFGGQALALAGPSGYLRYGWLISDGVYTDWGQSNLLVGAPIWFGFGAGYDVPLDWQTKNTTIQLFIDVPDGGEATVAFDGFSMFGISKNIQYLPIMGIG